MSIEQFIDNEVKSNDVVLFMKGTPQFPQCGFSGQVVQILDHIGVGYKGLNVLESADLLGGGGVDGAIHRAAGSELLAECRTLHGCATGDAKITRGYRLPARHVIHAVGPVWNGGNRGEDQALASCYARAIELCQTHGLAPAAYPAISTAVYRLPAARALRIALSTVVEVLAGAPVVERVIFCCFSNERA